MPASPKILRRIENLIRLTTSSTFDGERTNAAVEAVRLIHEHGVGLTTTPAPKPARKRVRPSTQQMSDWKVRVASKDGECGECGLPYSRGDSIWFDPPTGRAMHIDWPDCGE